MEKTTRFAEGILIQKTRRHLTWTQVAALIGLTRQALDRRLKGETKWKYEELDKLATTWHTTVEHLADGFGDNHTGDIAES